MNYKETCRRLAGNDEEYIFLSGVFDKMTACKGKNILTATKFLDTRQLSLTKQLLTASGCNNYTFDGGTTEAERRVCVFMPDYPIEHDLFRFIRAEKSKQDTLTHCDYLGSLMGLGIKRDCIGDIFVHENGAEMVVVKEIADFLMLEYKKAGRKQLTLKFISKDDISTGVVDFKLIRAIVSSMRLDAITAAAFKLSRSDSAELIQKGKLLLNAAECLKPEKITTQGDKITLRGKGKAIITEIGGKTKKDRIVLEIKVLGKA